MSEKIKLGLTRNRLFEFDNCVLLCGKYNCGFDKERLKKTLKLLCLKEPIITSRIELEEDGTAYVVTDVVGQEIRFSEECSEDVLSHYEENGLDFWDGLFEFSVTADNCLVIAAHTAVADAKALLRLACDFSVFYREPMVSVEPSVINLISEKNNLPIEVASPVIDRLSADLDTKWHKSPKFFSVDDYKKAKESYKKQKASRGHINKTLDSDVVVGLREYCARNNMDVSSAVAFAFYEALVKNIGGKKKFNKMNIYADERLFFDNFNDYRIGAYNGTVSAYLRKKDETKSVDDKAKQFHLDCYKGATSTFKVFYDDVLLMRVSPSFCDSAYMVKAGVFKNKVSQRLADNYGCSSEVICDYFFCNLDQKYWSEADNYTSLDFCEPLKMRSATYLNFIIHNGEGNIVFKFKEDKCDPQKAEKIANDAMEIIMEFTKN